MGSLFGEDPLSIAAVVDAGDRGCIAGAEAFGGAHPKLAVLAKPALVCNELAF